MSLFDRVNNFVLGVLLIVIGFSILNTVYGSWSAKGYTIKNGTLVVDEPLPNSKVIKAKQKQKKKLLEKRWKNKRMKTKASWYGPGFHKRKTANGERYNMYAMTAAHREIPFGSVVKVTNLKNNKSVLVTINDRGPVPRDRGIDLSKKANEKLDCNLCNVELKVLKVGDNLYKHNL